MVDLLIACSPGGHFSEARDLINDLENIDYKFVLHQLAVIPPEMKDRIIIAPHAERDPRLLLQFLFALYCVWKERPLVVMSTGASIGVTFGLAAKLFGAHFIFVESPTRVLAPSLAARISSYFADEIYVRHKSLQKKIPNALYYGDTL